MGKGPLSEDQRRLVEDHMGIVDHYARTMATRDFPEDDRRQCGCLGLMDAARAWDPGRGVKFATYAAARVVGAILDAEREGAGTIIRVPRHMWAKMTPEERAGSQPSVRLRRERNPHRRERFSRPDVVLDLAVKPEEPAVPFDAEAVGLAVDRLGERSAAIIRLYYWEGLPMREVGRRLGISEGRVSQKHAEILEWLRENRLMQMAAAG